MPHHDEPNWKDVAWDRRASDAAIAALRRAASEIDQTLEADGRHGKPATAEWRGRARDDFDLRRGQLRSMLIDLAAACRSVAEQVYRASARAEAEQRERERAREEWEREQRRRRSNGS